MNVPQDDLNVLLEVAEDLKIKGLSEKRSEGINTKLKESPKENGFKDTDPEHSNHSKENVEKFRIEKENFFLNFFICPGQEEYILLCISLSYQSIILI